MRQGSTLVRIISPFVARQSVTPRSGTKSSIAARLVARAVIGKRAATPFARVRSMPRNVASRRSQYCPAYCRLDDLVLAVRTQPHCRLGSIDCLLVQLVSVDYVPLNARTGVCREQAKGQCRLLHDRTKVAVCPAWLSGTCATSHCPLQHEARPELMPLCTFFLKVRQHMQVLYTCESELVTEPLAHFIRHRSRTFTGLQLFWNHGIAQGACTKDSCPYLHKKVDAAAPVCRAFVEGVCLRGVLCPHKHLSARMVKELRASRTLGATSQVPVHAHFPPCIHLLLCALLIMSA